MCGTDRCGDLSRWQSCRCGGRLEHGHRVVFGEAGLSETAGRPEQARIPVPFRKYRNPPREMLDRHLSRMCTVLDQPHHRGHCRGEEVTDRIRIVRRLEFTRCYRIDVTYDEHSRILHALLQHDGLQAKVLLQKHICVSRDEVKNITLHTLQNAKPKKVETTA